jgi:hypothetical protein
LLLCLALFMVSRPAFAQEETTNNEPSFWAGFMSAWFVAPKWSIWFDTHYNVRAFFVLRGGMTYNFHEGPRLTAGYAHLLLDPGNGGLTRNELRPWAQLVFPFSFDDHWSFSQRLRFDFRFRENVDAGEVTDGYGFTFRLRSQSALSYWFTPPARVRPFLQAADEILVNLAGEVGPNYMDQNRISLMTGVKIGPYTFRAGYMNRFLPGSSGINRVFEHNAIVWMNYVFQRPSKVAPTLPEEGNP